MSDFDQEFGGEEEMLQTLTEFYRAGRQEGSVATGIPPAADVSSNVTTLHGTQFPTRVAEPPQQTARRDTKVRPETEFDFGQYHYYFPGRSGPFSFTLQMQISCHNEGAVPISPLSIAAKGNWITNTTPSQIGNISFAWDNTQWLPGKHDEQPIIATAYCYLEFHPALTSSYLTLSLALRNSDPPNDWVETLFYVGERQDVWFVHNEVFPPLINGRWGSGVQVPAP